MEISYLLDCVKHSLHSQIVCANSEMHNHTLAFPFFVMMFDEIINLISLLEKIDFDSKYII